MHESCLISDLKNYNKIKFDNIKNKQYKIKALMNITIPIYLSNEFYQKQDEYLNNLLKNKTILFNEDISIILNCLKNTNGF